MQGQIKKKDIIFQLSPQIKMTHIWILDIFSSFLPFPFLFEMIKKDANEYMQQSIIIHKHKHLVPVIHTKESIFFIIVIKQINNSLSTVVAAVMEAKI